MWHRNMNILPWDFQLKLLFASLSTLARSCLAQLLRRSTYSDYHWNGNGRRGPFYFYLRSKSTLNQFLEVVFKFFMKSKKLSGLCSVSAIEKTIRKIRSKKIIWSKFLTSQHIFHNLFFKIFHNLSTCFKYHSSKILLVVFFQKFFESSSHHIFIIDSSTYFPNRPFNIIR